MAPETIGEMVKVRLRGPDAGDIETVWAKARGPKLYCLDNSPFFAYGLSQGDVVEALPAKDGVLEYSRAVEKSGNRTLRVIFQDYSINDRMAQEILRFIRDLGATYEGMQPRMVSINVPPRVDLDEVTDFLSDQQGLQWEYGDPTYDEIRDGSRSRSY